MLQPQAVRPYREPPPMGRRRTINHDLPPRMARKGASYYYVCSGPSRKWIPLGKDLSRARRKWAELEGPGEGLSVGELVQRFIDREERPASTMMQYRSYQKALALAFPIPAAQLRSTHVALWRELQKGRKHYANGCIAVLTAACRLGAELGLSERITVGKWKLEARDRYLTDDEFRAIRERATEWLQIAMDIAYLTASRPSDIRGMKWSDVGSALTVRQQKTAQRMSFAMTPELSSTLERARARRVLGLYVCATDRGKRITKDRMDDDWRAACAAAGVVAQFRDIRAKAATDAKSGGQDYQALLGHTTKAMSDRYIKGMQTVVAEPVRRKL